MSAGIDISTAMTLAKTQTVSTPHASGNPGAAKKAAQQFESVFISEFLGQMLSGISTDGPFGGGEGEQMFRSLMLDEYGKQMEKQGGFGLSAPVANQLLKLQEARS